MKKILKKYDYLIYTFLLGFIIVCAIYKLQDVAPFGRNSLLTVDFFHQYGPMLAEFFDRIHQGENILYSFNTGLGLPIFRNFFNYLSSPLNVIMFLFKRKYLIMSYSIIIGLKAILSAITMNYYLTKKHNTKNLVFIGLSLLYAFSAYFTAYYWNIMWLDGLIMLPLITLGIENIVNKNNGLLYTISLIIMLFTNYFIGYMICIFACIYFIAYLIIKSDFKKIKKILKIIGKFTICSLISGLLLSWELIPMFEALTSTNATTGTMPFDQYYAFNILEFIKNHLTGVTSTVFASDISNCPNISCGILSVSLLIAFIFDNKVNIKRKIIYLSLLIILFLSFYLAPLDYIWHAFHVPNDLPYRYSFIYSFILIIISSYTIKNIKNVKIYKMIISYIVALLLIAFVFITKYENISNEMLLINIFLITTYFLIFILYRVYPKLKQLALVLFIIVISLECIISVNHNWDILQYIDEFYSTYQPINSSTKNIKKSEDELFYRTEKNYILTLNDGAWYDYYGMSTFSSMAYQDIAKLNNNLGMPGNNINSYYYKQNTPIYDLMFNMKYIIGNNYDNTRYKIKVNSNDSKTYEFKYNIGLMYGVNNSIKKWKYNYINPFEYQNDFIENTTNIENTLYRLTLKEHEIIFNNKNETIVKYTYINSKDNLYFYTNNSLVNYILIGDTLYYKNDIDINNIAAKLNTEISNYETYDEEYVINYINTIDEDINIYVGFSTYLNEEIDTYTINQDKFIKAYNILNTNKVNITKFNENIIEANINLKENKTIYTSIPYDKGWKVFVNDKEIKTYPINETLLGFDLKKGNNKIKLKYIPNNLNIGLSISLITLTFIFIYIIIKKKTNLT